MLTLSQSHLTSLDSCARKYQHIFYDALSGPSNYEQHITTQWGSQFHLLMQQQALDLPVGVLAEANADMSTSLAALEKAAPEVFAYLPESNARATSEQALEVFSQSEHHRTSTFNGYLLTAVYDLVVISTQLAPQKGQIFDWKTHQQPPKKERLANDWQTRLYPYILCETSELNPDDISMTYWFVRVNEKTSSQPSFHTFNYSLAQHDQTRQDLQRLTDELTLMREQAAFPKVAIEKGHCDRCPFNVRCDRVSPDEYESIETGHHAPSLPHQNSPHHQTPSELLKAARQLTADNVPEIPL